MGYVVIKLCDSRTWDNIFFPISQTYMNEIPNWQPNNLYLCALRESLEMCRNLPRKVNKSISGMVKKTQETKRNVLADGKLV